MKAAVIGGGISGLAAAWELLKEGVDVELFEGAERVGGVIHTTRRGPYLFESGPNTVMATLPSFYSLVDELGLREDMLVVPPEDSERYLYFKGSLHPLPKSFKEFLKTDLFTWPQKLRVLMEPLIPKGDPDHEETVAEWFGRRIGRGLTMTWIDIVVTGIYAGNPNMLGIQSAFPDLHAMEEKYGSVFKAMKARAQERREKGGRKTAMVSFKQGLQQMIDALSEKLGERIHLRHAIRRIATDASGGFALTIQEPGGLEEEARFDRVVMAVPAQTAGILLAEVAPEVSDLLFEIESVDMVVVQAGFDREALPGLPHGFGFLIPRSMRMRTLGWIFSSEIFPQQNPEGKVSMIGMMGGALDPQCLHVSDEQIQHLMLGELALCLDQSKTPSPEVFEPIRWKGAIPQYNVGHKRRIEAVKTLLAGQAPGLSLAGNWVEGVSVEKCIDRGRRAALEVLAREVGAET